MYENECSADEVSSSCAIPKRDLSYPTLLTVSDEVKAHIATILRACGRDPSKAWAGWRSEDPFVVALLFAAWGYPVFPCTRFKHPMIPHGFKNATCHFPTLLYWARDIPAAGWCVRTGRYDDPNGPPGLWIFDIDDAAGYARWAELEAELGPFCTSWSCMSARPGGGEHRLVMPANYGPDMKSLGHAMIAGKRGNVDQKGRGGYAVISGSGHLSMARYYWKPGCAPDEVPISEAPPAWVAAMDKADETAAPPSGVGRSKAAPHAHREHDPSSLLIGDGEGFGGFQNPVFKWAIRFFLQEGIEAPAEPIIEVLRELITDAPKDHGRDVSRYMSGPDLPRIVERARAFVIKVKENESDQY